MIDDPVADAANDAEVVGDDGNRGPAAVAQLAEQHQDFFLDGGVECGRGLVCEQAAWGHRACHRDQHPLPHAAGELVRVLPQTLLRRRHVHRAQELELPLAQLRPRNVAARRQHFAQLIADREQRIERGHRVLQDHRDLAAPHLPELVLRQRMDRAAVETDVAGDASGLRQRADQCGAERGLAAARFTGDADDLLRRRCRGRPPRPPAPDAKRAERDGKVADLEAAFRAVREDRSARGASARAS
jgi:hypothetical protein